MDLTPLFSPEQKRFFQNRRVAHLATVSPAGHPYIIPVCFAFDGQHIFSVIDEKPKSVEAQRLRRVRNILLNPKVSLVADHYSDDWSKLGYVLVFGRAQVVEGGPVAHEAMLLLREKYLQYRHMALEDRPLLVITPERVTSWGRLDA